MGPLIQAALRRGWQLEVWLYIGEESKEYLGLRDQPVPPLLAGKVGEARFANKAEVQGLADDFKPHAIFSLHPRSHYLLEIADGVPFVTLHHGVDTFVEAKPTDLLSSNLLCLQSPFWLEWGCRYYQQLGLGQADELHRELSAKTIYPGTPRLDIRTQLEPRQIRHKFGIPKEKPVVLYLPVNLAYWPGAWPGFFASTGTERIKAFARGLREEGLSFFKYLCWLILGWGDAALTQSIKAFCERNNAFLIAKARRKDPLRQGIEELADLAIYDEDYFPATIYELLSVADVCIHSYSSAAFEMSVFGVFGLCLDRHNLNNLVHRLWRTAEPGSIFNFSGVNLWKSIPQTIRQLPSWDLTDLALKAETLERYTRSYVDPGNGSSSERILDAVASLVESKKSVLPLQAEGLQ